MQESLSSAFSPLIYIASFLFVAVFFCDKNKVLEIEKLPN